MIPYSFYSPISLKYLKKSAYRKSTTASRNKPIQQQQAISLVQPFFHCQQQQEYVSASSNMGAVDRIGFCLDALEKSVFKLSKTVEQLPSLQKTQQSKLGKKYQQSFNSIKSDGELELYSQSNNGNQRSVKQKGSSSKNSLNYSMRINSLSSSFRSS